MFVVFRKKRGSRDEKETHLGKRCEEGGEHFIEKDKERVVCNSTASKSNMSQGRLSIKNLFSNAREIVKETVRAQKRNT
jgi:hypothetical protein